jgi:nicotinamidase-related amidase
VAARSGRRLRAAVAGLALFCLPSFARGAPGEPPPGPEGSPPGLDPAAARGRIVYREGRSPSGGTVRALVGGTAIPGEAVPCIGCHGPDGRGRPEGGVAPPEITWETLAKPYGHLHPRGRKHPAFDDRTAARAVTEGIDPAGNPLASAMPRYSLPASDLRDLLAYLRHLDREEPRGVTAETIRVATVLPSRGPLAPLAADLREFLEAEFGELNRNGGIHGRRVELVVAVHDGGPGGGARELAELHRRAPVFAVLGGVAPGAEEDLARWAAAEEVPWIGPLTHLELPAGGPWVFRPTAGLSEEARILVRHAAAGEPGGSASTRAGGRRGVVLHPRQPGHAAAARAAVEEGRRVGVHLEAWEYEAGHLDPGLADRLRERGIGDVLFLGGDRDLEAFARRAEAIGYGPRLLVPGSGAVRAAVASGAAARDRVRFAFAALPGGERPEAVEALARRSPAFGSGRYRPALTAAHAAVAVLAEGLRCSGRKLDGRRFVACLEGIGRIDTGLGPPIRFGPGARAGATGGYIVAPDPEGRTFRRVGDFVRL